MSIENIIALATAMGAIITAIWTARSMATKSELESLRLTIIGLQAENSRLRDRVKELEDRNDTQDKASDCLEDRVKILENENTRLRGEVELLKVENVKLEKENAALRTRISELEKGKAE